MTTTRNRHATRVMYAPPGTQPSDLRDILITDRGAQQYDSVTPWRDLGASKIGFEHVDGDYLMVQIAEMFELPDMFARDLLGGTFALAALWQDNSRIIHATVWPQVKLDPPKAGKPRGEASALPLFFKLLSGEINL